MDKRLSKIILAITVGAMAIVAVCVGILNKEDYKVIDIEGNRKELEDVVVSYQEKKGFYKTTQVNISKDNINVDNYAKEMPIEIDLSNFNKKNRDMLDMSYTDNKVYKDNKSIINVQVYRDYDYYDIETNKVKLGAFVKEKDLENNKTVEVQIPLDSNFEYGENTDVWHNAAPIKYNGQVYIAVATNMESATTDEVEDKSKIGSFIEVYKLDIKNKTSQIVFSEKISKESKNIRINNMFMNKNSFYFVKETEVENEKKEISQKTELLEYNLETKNLTSMEIPINSWGEEFTSNQTENSSSSMYVNSSCELVVEDNKVTFITDIYNKIKSEMYIYKTVIDLENNKVVSNNEKYTIKTDDLDFKYNVTKVRNINDKLYIAVSAIDNDSDARAIPSLYKDYIYVIDENSKETVYTGQISKEKIEDRNVSILKKDEL